VRRAISASLNSRDAELSRGSSWASLRALAIEAEAEDIEVGAGDLGHREAILGTAM
jgi:hypothetical protein